MMLRKISLTGILMVFLAGCNMPAFAFQVSPTAPLPTSTSAPTPFQFADGYQTATPFLPLNPTLTPFLLATPTAQQDEGLAQQTHPKKEPGAPKPFPLLSDGDSVNALLIGADSRSGGYFRTDTLMIASLRPKERLVTLISIPRDLYVYIPSKGMNRINTAYLYGKLEKYPGGGEGLLKETILYNLGVRIDHVAVVDFNGFRKIIDALGGIDVPLVCSYTDWHIKDPKVSDQILSNWALYTVGPGLVHMDGDLALWYARSRQRSNDFDRGRRQQEVMRAAFAQVRQANLIPRLPELYAQMKDSVSTDVGLKDLLALAPVAARMKAAQIRSYYINDRLVTPYRTPQGASVLRPKQDKVRALIQEAMSPPDEVEIENLGLLVEVVNASGQEGWDTLAAERLHYAGYATQLFLQGDGVEGEPSMISSELSAETMLYDLTAEGDPDKSAALLYALGLSISRLRSNPQADRQTAFRLVIGQDYDPCFKPFKLSH